MGYDNKHKVEIAVFDGGLNTKANPFILPLNQSPQLKAVQFDDYGALQNINGFSTYNSGRLNVSTQRRIEGLISFKPSTMSALLVAICDGFPHVATGIATAFNEYADATSFVSFVPCESVQFQELAFFSNSVDQPSKFNGREWTLAGVSAPTQALSAFSNAGAGNLTGSYTYVYTGVNSYSAEGDYAGTSPSITVTTAHVRVTNIPTAPVSHGINSWNIYRNTANAQGIYWLITAVTNGVTSFTDNVADTSLTVAAPTDQGYLRKFKFLIAYAGRLWGAVEDFLWYSEINEPETFPSTNFVRVGRGDGMNISSIASFKGMIVVSKSDYAGKTAIYQLLIGDSVSFSDPENWYLNKISDFGGSESQRATVAYSNYLMLYNRDGAYAFNGAAVSPTGNATTNGQFIADTISENIGTNLAPYPEATKLTSGINFKNKIYISPGRALSTVSNEDLYIFDYARISGSDRKGGAWSYHPENLVSIGQFVIHENMLLGTSNWSGSDGYVLKLNDSIPTGKTITILYVTAPIKGREEHESHTKHFRWAYITVSGAGLMGVGYQVDINGRTAAFSVIEAVALTLSTTITRYKIDLKSVAVGTSIVFRFTQVASPTANFNISKLELFYSLKGIRNA